MAQFLPKRPGFLLKLAIGLLLLFINAMMVMAVTNTTTSFTGQTNPFNITFTGGDNQTAYIRIPSYSAVINLSFYIDDVSTNSPNNDIFLYWNGENYTETINGTVSLINNNLNVVNISIDPGYMGNAFNFSGGNGILFNNTINHTGLGLNETRSIEFWFRPLATGYQTFLALGRDVTVGVDHNLVLFTYTDSNGANFRFRERNQAWQTLSNSHLITLGGYHHIALVMYDNSSAVMYINGTITASGAISFRPRSNWTALTVGGAYRGTTATGFDFGNGHLDNLVIWNKTLTTEEVNASYNSGKGRYYFNNTQVEINASNNIILNSTYSPSDFLVEADASSINTILQNNCNCSGCLFNNYVCDIPLIFYSSIGGILTVNLTNASYGYGIDNCTNSFGIDSNGTALNLSYLDNQSNPVNVTHNTFISFPGGNFSQDDIIISEQSYCVYPSWFNFTIDQLIEYTYSSTIYDYFLNDYPFSNTTQLIDLFIQSGTSQVLFTVLDRGQEVENAYIHILKYDVGTGTYTLQEIIRTDTQGQAIGNIVLATTFYNFLIYYDNEIVYTETGAKLVTTTRTFNVNLLGNEWLDDFDSTLNVNTQLYYNNNTQNFVFTWSDPNGEVISGCLRVDHVNDTGKRTLVDNCTLTASGTIVYNIAPLENGTEYIGTGYFIFDDYEVIAARVSHSVAKVTAYFREDPMASLFIAFLLTLIFFLMGIPNPVIAEVLLGVGVIITYMMGLFAVSITQVGAIIVLIIIQIYAAGRQ